MGAAKPVALISMPTLSARFPCFQLGLLRPTLERAGIPAQSFSLYMYFGAAVGWPLHEALAEVYPCLVGEWLWAKAAFGEFADDDAYFRRYEDTFRSIERMTGATVADIRRARDEAVPRFLDFCVESIDWSRFGLVGFTVLFQQQLASLALARRLKERFPALPVIMGGGTFEDDIAAEFLRNCPAIDFVHCGDADTSFPEMVRRLYAGESMRGLAGVMWRDGARLELAGRAENHADMDATPVPDYDEYFYARRESGYDAWEGARVPMLPIETARGCWWGMKAHCTFCGLNRAGMEFRAKSVPRVLDMLEALAHRYDAAYFNAIDNIIAPSYVEQLFGALAGARTDLKLHYEIKANLTREQLGRMKQGGLSSVQPGVESFSTHVLRLMKKGTTAVRNLELVKWCTYFGIENLYNILVGFSGETREDYAAQVELIAKVPHLQPPYAIVRARPDRGSPMFTDPAGHAITALAPEPAYEWLFPAARFDLRHVSYYFRHEMTGVLSDAELAPIFDLVAAWQDRWRRGPRPFLRYRKAFDHIVIEDGRGERPRTFRYEGRAARLYEEIADAHGRDVLAARLGAAADGAWIDALLEEFRARDLAVSLDGRWLALALPENPSWGLPAPAREREAEAAPAGLRKLATLPPR
jgi:ribosomal peptide maturation radical SAM protein 1